MNKKYDRPFFNEDEKIQMLKDKSITFDDKDKHVR